LREFDCIYNTLELTQENLQWLEDLMANECEVCI
jgi:hypothetical protein